MRQAEFLKEVIYAKTRRAHWAQVPMTGFLGVKHARVGSACDAMR